MSKRDGHPFNSIDFETFQDKLECARLRLMLLKENFEYRKFFETFKALTENFSDDYYSYPIESFYKFGMIGISSVVLKVSLEQLLDVLDPQKDLTETPSKVTSWILSHIFYSHAVEQIKFNNEPKTEGVAVRALNAVERAGLKPYERLIKIDLRKEKVKIKEEFGIFLDYVYKFRDFSISRQENNHFYDMIPNNTRDRQETWRHLEVWKLRKKRLPFSKIAEQLKLTEDNTKKSFYKACELTQGRKYEPEMLKKEIWRVKIEELQKTCDNCPDRDTCTMLCPEVLGLVDQDTLKYTREKLFSDINYQF